MKMQSKPHSVNAPSVCYHIIPQIGDHTKANKQARENESNRRQWMKQEQFEANQHK